MPRMSDDLAAQEKEEIWEAIKHDPHNIQLIGQVAQQYDTFSTTVVMIMIDRMDEENYRNFQNANPFQPATQVNHATN